MGSFDAGADPDSSSADACLKTAAPTVLGALGHVAMRVYREGVSSERTTTALRAITGSLPLREAVERGSAQATAAAAQTLIATGHMTNLRVLRAVAPAMAPVMAPLRCSPTSVRAPRSPP